MELDLSGQASLVEALKQTPALADPAGRPQHLQTHISHVLLAGDYAYKLKKPLDLGFLDFSTLERRRHCCEEEIRLNRRLAPAIYLDVVAVTGTPEHPELGGTGPVLDYGVRMRRFDQGDLLSRQEVTPELVDRIASRAADFHAAIPAAPADTPFGSPEVVLFPMQQNFDQIRGLVRDDAELARLQPLEAWTQGRYGALRELLATRKAEGHIRECHGDMHLGNIALVQGDLVIFDGIEFNPDLRWIDTMNEVAFLVMDLEQAGRQALARRFLNRYLELSGDYEGLALLDFYKAYRALVRAKVTAIRLAQPDLAEAERAAVLAEYGRYVALAESYVHGRPVALLITHGVSGAGKTRLGAALVEAVGVLRVRSDVERKRLFGLAEGERSGSAVDVGIYTAEASRRTYERLAALARQVLAAGCPVLVDATFLKRAQRESFAALAAELGRPLVILDLQASEAELRERVARRLTEGADASEASLEVLERQLAGREPLTQREQARVIA
jgi:uncharacterized protein